MVKILWVLVRCLIYWPLTEYNDIADILYRSEGKAIWAVGEVKKDGVEIKEIYKI